MIAGGRFCIYHLQTKVVPVMLLVSNGPDNTCSASHALASRREASFPVCDMLSTTTRLRPCKHVTDDAGYIQLFSIHDLSWLLDCNHDNLRRNDKKLLIRMVTDYLRPVQLFSLPESVIYEMHEKERNEHNSDNRRAPQIVHAITLHTNHIHIVETCQPRFQMESFILA